MRDQQSSNNAVMAAIFGPMITHSFYGSRCLSTRVIRYLKQPFNQPTMAMVAVAPAAATKVIGQIDDSLSAVKGLVA